MTSASSQSPAHRPVPGPARRTVVAAVGAAGVAAALTACGSDDGSTSASSDGTGSASPDGAGKDSPGGPAGAGGKVLAKTADIPEGGGKVFKDAGVVVTQPTAGTFKAFSSKCTHAGCSVADVVKGSITCPCHNSAFSAGDGSVQKGPATRPLPAARITVEGDSIRLD